MSLKIILFQPEIPQNAGNIVRTCAVTGSELIMVRPLGFHVNDKQLMRAGLDYWEGAKVSYIDDLEAYLNQVNFPFYFFSSKASRGYSTINYTLEDALIFGCETSGLPSQFLEKWPERFLTIPMKGQRCLNLANSVCIPLYEAWRQNHFA